MQTRLLLSVSALGLALASLPAHGASQLPGAAAASPRPPECRNRVSVSGSELWGRARVPELARFCDALARGYARLGRAPSDALIQADKAERALPGRAATWVLRGRAHFALGRFEPAWQAFVSARKLAPRSLDAPGALHDFARSALRTAHYAEALTAYRALVPRAALFDSETLQQRVHLEAAAQAMWTGPTGLGEALGYLSEARRAAGTPGLEDLVLGALALTLDRQGRQVEAEGVLREVGSGFDPGALAKSAHAPELPPGELLALSAMISGRRDPGRAQAEWSQFVASQPSSPWLAHARAKLAALSRGRAKGTH
ncbi:MAG TPA: hypothetical protein VK509_05470 [Polyangiales bacterium]|nr:hypothetical protein [Polyangiales bacterium]